MEKKLIEFRNGQFITKGEAQDLADNDNSDKTNGYKVTFSLLKQYIQNVENSQGKTIEDLIIHIGKDNDNEECLIFGFYNQTDKWLYYKGNGSDQFLEHINPVNVPEILFLKPKPEGK